ncbi:MAG TPA: HyaD/HybD family hydrogenase maturation endopeptidase [Burkholderiaceae bacterium]
MTIRAVVLGVGNLLLGDEGAGPRTIEALARDGRVPLEVALIDGGTSAMELLDDLAGADLLLIVDAVAHGAPPGAVVVLEGEQVPEFFTLKLSPHQVGLSDVLATLRLLDQSPRETVIIGVQPQTLAMGLQLSPPVAAAVPQLVGQVIARLERAGLRGRGGSHGARPVALPAALPAA